MDRRGGTVLVELVRLAVVVACAVVGYQVARALAGDPQSPRIVLGAALGSGIGYVGGGVLGRKIGLLVGVAERHIAQTPGADLVAGTIGAVAGVLLSSLLAWPLLLLPGRALAVPILFLVSTVVGSLGYRVGVSKREDLLQLAGLTYRTRAPDLRVLDTSAVLDARLLDFVRAGLLRGTFLLPAFVLEEAQAIADSADPVRRKRARRGLEALAAIRDEGLVDVRAVEKSYPEYDDVDAKVVALARERGASLVTDDLALSRVAELQGIEVLLLRRAAAALGPEALPGERVRLELVRAGREDGQAVGYLEDGTMVVVEDARALLGSTADVVISRVVRTSGGRMLFARATEGPTA